MSEKEEAATRRKTVLFLCDHNSARSQMAEGFLKHYAAEHFDVYSAGLAPTALHPLAVQVMAEVGIDISQQHAKGIRDYLGRLAVSYAIFVCHQEEDACPALWPFGGLRLRWSFDDPTRCVGTEEEILQQFRAIRDAIGAAIRDWIATAGRS